MVRKKSSSAISSLAARVLKIEFAADGPIDFRDYNTMLGNAKALAGSVLSQDETKGQLQDSGDLR